MADKDTDVVDSTDEITDDDSFVAHIVGKYEKEDRAHAEKEDMGEGDEEGTEEDGDESADDDDEEHPESGTSDEEEDEPSKESDDDSAEADDDEHTDDESDSDEDDDATDDEDEAEGDEDGDEEDADAADDEDEDASAGTKAALASAGADLKLDDIPEKYRPIVEKKLKGIDAAFTRYAQEAASTRAVRAEVEAFKKFQKENPELALIEIIQAADEDLIERVNARVKELADPTVKEAFEIVLKKKKEDIKAEVTAAIGKEDRTESRIVEVETVTRKLAADNGVPFWIADEAVGSAILLKQRSEKGSDLTNEEIAATVARVAKNYRLENRANGRRESKDVVKARVEGRKKATPTKKPANASSPRPNKKKEVIDFSNQESRERAILRSARRIIPGVKD